MTKLEQTLFESRKAAKELYASVCIDQDMPIKYTPLDETTFNQIKDNFQTITEYKREYKGYQCEVLSHYGFRHYLLNILRPDGMWLNGEFVPRVIKPELYNRVFGIGYEDLIYAQNYMRFNLENVEKIDCGDFIVEQNENWPCYYFQEAENSVICMTAKFRDKNLSITKVCVN